MTFLRTLTFAVILFDARCLRMAPAKGLTLLKKTIAGYSSGVVEWVFQWVDMDAPELSPLPIAEPVTESTGPATPHVGTLDYATAASDEERRQQLNASGVEGGLQSGVDLSFVPDLGGVGDVLSGLGTLVGDSLGTAANAGGAIAEAVGEVAGGLLEGFSL